MGSSGRYCEGGAGILEEEEDEEDVFAVDGDLEDVSSAEEEEDDGFVVLLDFRGNCSG
eukprot:CAMPEP_0183728640 /NCGR_PEP_ID=MMETSP0737-20130205/28587_1 /TAXON_ID=385413 /ORGANISM="Thalassiosira miniscula, Strain CCMP1093" /LENGTH=57 /DNA_ID=CAMNT_0025960641 /DNA_START=1 /DNA_END=174 /DNA_ORIENTATION=+